MRSIRTAALALVALSTVAPLGAQQLEEAAQEIANQISLSLISGGKRNIAILPFTGLDNKVTTTGEIFAEELYNRLFLLRQDRYDIVERSKVAAVWKEQREFSDQWYIDQMQGFSQVLGADAILVGTLYEWEGYHRINARLLAVPTAQLFAAASTRMQASGRPKNQDGGGGGGGGAGGASPVAVEELAGLRVELLSCTLRGDSLLCDFAATTTNKDQTEYLRESRIVERNGNEIAASSQQFGESVSRHGGQVRAALVRGIPIRGRVIFTGLDPSAGEISLVEMRFDRLTAQFRGVRPE